MFFNLQADFHIHDVTLQHLSSILPCGTTCFDCPDEAGRGHTERRAVWEFCEEKPAPRGHLQVRWARTKCLWWTWLTSPDWRLLQKTFIPAHKKINYFALNDSDIVWLVKSWTYAWSFSPSLPVNMGQQCSEAQNPHLGFQAVFLKDILFLWCFLKCKMFMIEDL